MSYEKAKDLLDPADKQNVPKAVNLIQNLLKLETEESIPMLPNIHMCYLVFTAKVFNCFMAPFITVTMSISQQIRSLSAYTHLATAMYIKSGLGFMNGALYADSQAIVKNIMFTAAKLQKLSPDIKYYITLEGTDRLENLFSNCRTQDHARNFDILQLSQKLSIAAEITAIFEKYPDLDRGHRRRNLDGASGIDHVNPASWIGDVRVGSVDLVQEWKNGRDDAEHMLQTYLG
ncbi:hypothetical protein OF83DRAFT_1041650, partial [Amylostereum chailletii]